MIKETKKRIARALTIVAAVALATTALWPSLVEASTTLDPQNPTATFTKEGNESFTPGAVLTLNDTSVAEFIAFYAADIDAVPGAEVDIFTTFQIRQTGPNNADAGNRVVINDGVTRSAIAACIIKNGERGVGLLSQGAASDPNSYPVFVPVDWQAAPVTIRLRRYANGDAELIEVNGVPPDPRAILPAAQCPGPTRGGPSVDFGARSVEATCTVEYAVFRSEAPVVSAEDLGPGDGGLPGKTALLPLVPNPSPGTIQLSFRLEDPGSVQLEIFDVSGRSVAKPPTQNRPAGTWSMLWNGRDVPAGVYWVRMSLDSKEIGRKRFILLP